MSTDKPRKIAICGTAPSSYPFAPVDDPDWEIWGTSRLYQQISRWDAWFELHDLDKIGKGWGCGEAQRKKRRDVQIAALGEMQTPVYLQHEDERIPSGVAYPLDDVLAFLTDRFGPERYLTNTVSYMLALAIYELDPSRGDQIGIWGVDMALTEEWAYQRPSCEYLVGIARGYGLDVFIPPEADLLKANHLYGYEDDNPFSSKIRMRKRELEARKQQAVEQRNQATEQHAFVHGQIRTLEHVCENGIPEEHKDQLMQWAAQLTQQATDLETQVEMQRQQIAGFNGALDNMLYIERSWA